MADGSDIMDGETKSSGELLDELAELLDKRNKAEIALMKEENALVRTDREINALLGEQARRVLKHLSQQAKELEYFRPSRVYWRPRK